MKICAIVVTYNRKLLLEKLLKLLLVEKLLDKVFVIDNASNDGSSDFLFKNGVLPCSKIEYIRLETNEGGAGGFSFGLSLALNSGFDYAWLMDDDGYPFPSCLGTLLTHCDKQSVVGPVVLEGDGSPTSHLSFPLRISNSFKILNKLEEYLRLYPDQCEGTLFPFNGTFIPMSIVEKIGFPRKEYFIWGDETEYVLRIKNNGYTVKTISKAYFYHPRSKNSNSSMFFGLLQFNEPSSDLKCYCYVRNNLKNMLEYKSIIHASLFLCKILWFYSFTCYNPEKLKIIKDAICDSLKGDFTKHKAFIKR